MADDNADARLQALNELKGPALVDALTGEFRALHREVARLRAELSAYRDFFAARDRWLALEGPHQGRIRLPRSVAIDASQLLHPRQGFYTLEHDDRGLPFCWTGPSSSFSFDVYIDRARGAQLELRALSCMNFERQRNIRLLANGESVPLSVSQSGHGLVISAELPATDDDSATSLVFSVPETIRPDGGDTRTLGIAFNALFLRAREERADAPEKTVVSIARGGKH